MSPSFELFTSQRSFLKEETDVAIVCMFCSVVIQHFNMLQEIYKQNLHTKICMQNLMYQHFNTMHTRENRKHDINV